MGRMKFGVHQALEDEANALIAQSIRAGGMSHSAKSDVLTPAKEQHRRRHEVLVSSGTPDPSTRRGMYHRAANRTLPHLNSRDGTTPAVRTPATTHGHSQSTLAEFVQGHLLS